MGRGRSDKPARLHFAIIPSRVASDRVGPSLGHPRDRSAWWAEVDADDRGKSPRCARAHVTDCLREDCDLAVAEPLMSARQLLSHRPR
ncbi:MAG: hypothetical protein K0S65_4562 [Labilithrix sp.]|nr:hypothetical protein [Labilithrix sp.]